MCMYVRQHNVLAYTILPGVSFAGSKGDVNTDNSVDSTDARLVLQYEVMMISLTEAQLENANVNMDDSVDSTDARLILQYEVGQG